MVLLACEYWASLWWLENTKFIEKHVAFFRHHRACQLVGREGQQNTRRTCQQNIRSNIIYLSSPSVSDHFALHQSLIYRTMQMYTDFHSHKKKKIIFTHSPYKQVDFVPFQKHKQAIIPISSRPHLQRYKRCYTNHMAGVTAVNERTSAPYRSVSSVLNYRS